MLREADPLLDPGGSGWLEGAGDVPPIEKAGSVHSLHQAGLAAAGGRVQAEARTAHQAAPHAHAAGRQSQAGGEQEPQLQGAAAGGDVRVPSGEAQAASRGAGIQHQGGGEQELQLQEPAAGEQAQAQVQGEKEHLWERPRGPRAGTGRQKAGVGQQLEGREAAEE